MNEVVRAKSKGKRTGPVAATKLRFNVLKKIKAQNNNELTVAQRVIELMKQAGLKAELLP